MSLYADGGSRNDTENSCFFEELDVLSDAVRTCHGAEKKNKGYATRQHNKMFLSLRKIFVERNLEPQQTK
jgi:hypothetical protein